MMVVFDNKIASACFSALSAVASETTFPICLLRCFQLWQNTVKKCVTKFDPSVLRLRYFKEGRLYQAL